MFAEARHNQPEGSGAATVSELWLRHGIRTKVQDSNHSPRPQWAKKKKVLQVRGPGRAVAATAIRYVRIQLQQVWCNP